MPACEQRQPPAKEALIGPVFAWQQDKVVHTFTVHNPTGRTVNILDVRTSCACTTSMLADKVLLPGEATELTLVVDVPSTGGYRGVYADLVTDLPSAETDDSAWRYELRCMAYPAAEMSLNVIRLSPHPDDPSRVSGSTELDVFAPVGQPLPQPVVECGDITVRLVMAPQETKRQVHTCVRSGRYLIVATQDMSQAKARSGQLGGFLLRVPGAGDLRGTLEWTELSGLAAAPDSLHVGLPDAADEGDPACESEPSRRVLVRRSDGKPFTVTGLRTTAGWLTAGVVTDADKPRPAHIGKVRFRPRHDAKFTTGTLEIADDRGDRVVVTCSLAVTD